MEIKYPPAEDKQEHGTGTRSAGPQPLPAAEAAAGRHDQNLAPQKDQESPRPISRRNIRVVGAVAIRSSGILNNLSLQPR